MISAAFVALAKINTLLCTWLLLIAILDGSCRSMLINIYIVENVTIIGFSIYLLVKLYSENVNDPLKILKRNLNIVWESYLDRMFLFFLTLDAFSFCDKIDGRVELEEVDEWEEEAEWEEEEADWREEEMENRREE
jgi:hypothetical protein